VHSSAGRRVYIRSSREATTPILEDLKELNTQLHEWETSDDPFKVAMRYWGYRDSDTLDIFGHELRREIKSIEPQCNTYAERINKKRQFNCNSDDDENDDDDANEDVWYTFLNLHVEPNFPTQLFRGVA